LNVQASKKKSIAKGKGKKTIPQKIVELPRDVTMVDYEATTSKRDLDGLLEGIENKCSSRCLDLSPKSRRPSSSRPYLSFGNSGRY